ncbi:hypothetical protein BSKO_00022 [Bryopsis sp. KO-2023]|nr:hypothetical protein BSKO_00022 [Bryopsis sp. KO-2023]
MVCRSPIKSPWAARAPCRQSAPSSSVLAPGRNVSRGRSILVPIVCAASPVAVCDDASNHDQNPSPVPFPVEARLPPPTAIFSLAVGGAIDSTSLQKLVTSIGAGSGGDGGGGGDGGHGDGFGGGDSGCGGEGFNEIFRLALDENDDEEEEESEDESDDAPQKEEGEEDEDYVDPSAPFYCSEMVSEGLMEGFAVPREGDLFAGLNCQPGFHCTQAELKKDLQTLSQTDGIDRVEVRVTPIKGTKGKKCQVKFIFYSKLYPQMKSFKVVGASAIPKDVVEKVMEIYNRDVAEGRSDAQTTMQTIGLMRGIVEKWYQDRGFIMSYIKQFDGLETGNVVAKVVEGRVNKVKVLYVDDEGQEKKKGNATPESYVRRELSFVPGMLYSQEDSRRALRDLIGTGMYENVQVLPEQAKKDEKKVDVTVMVKETPMRTTEIELDWRVRNNRNIPMLDGVVPGGTFIVDNRNLFGKGYNLTGTVTTSNILDPRDIGYKIEWRKPYVWGERDLNRTALSVTAFNARRVSGVFTGGPMGEDVPPIMVHRNGAKVALQQQYNNHSRGSLGVVLEEITALDDTGSIVSRGFRSNSQTEGPPTTLSEGQDQQIYIQGNVVRDTTYRVNGTPIGARDMLQVDQGTGVGGLFNRCQGSFTRFIQLTKPVRYKPPVSLVLHGKAGGCLGDLASYDAYCLGGPFSVRGLNIGEIGTARHFAEMGMELRLPTPYFNQQMFLFYEQASDLGSSKLVPGNPTTYFRKPGSGSTYGAGVRIGPIRSEWVRDRNIGRSHIMFCIGERY